MTTRVEVEEIETTASEKLLAAVLARRRLGLSRAAPRRHAALRRLRRGLSG